MRFSVIGIVGKVLQKIGIVPLLILLAVLLILGFVTWLTGGSGYAVVATIFLLAFAGIGIAAKAKILTLPDLVQTLLGWAAALCLIVIVWATVASWLAGKKAEWQKTSTATNTPAQSGGNTRVRRGNKPLKLQFGADGCVSVELGLGKVHFYPKGGEVEITPPPQSKMSAWRDKPGVDDPRGLLPWGMYKICRIDPSASGVDVWN